MKIEISVSEATENRLGELARAFGYESTEAFVSDHLATLSGQPASQELAPPSESELAETLAMLDESMAQIDAGQGLTVEQVLTSFAPPTQEALRASAERCDRGMADADAGRGVPAREALAEIAAELGLGDPSRQ